MKILKSAGMAAFIGALALTAQAQTNLVETYGFALSANYQGTNTTNGTTVKQNIKEESIRTPDIIKLLGAATMSEFSPAAQLLIVIPIIDGTNGSKSIVVRDVTSSLGTKVTTTTSTNKTTGVVTVHSVTNRVRIYSTNVVDVTGFFSVHTLADVTSSSTKAGVLGSESDFVARTFALVSDPDFTPLTTTFNLQGAGEVTYQKITLHDGLVVWGYNFYIAVNGTGTNAVEGNLVIGADPNTSSTVSVSDPIVVVGPGYAPTPAAD